MDGITFSCSILIDLSQCWTFVHITIVKSKSYSSHLLFEAKALLNRKQAGSGRFFMETSQISNRDLEYLCANLRVIKAKFYHHNHTIRWLKKFLWLWEIYFDSAFLSSSYAVVVVFVAYLVEINDKPRWFSHLILKSLDAPILVFSLSFTRKHGTAFTTHKFVVGISEIWNSACDFDDENGFRRKLGSWEKF